MKRFKKGLALILLMVLASCSGADSGEISTLSASETVESWMNDVQEKRFEEADELISETSEILRLRPMIESYESICQSLELPDEVSQNLGSAFADLLSSMIRSYSLDEESQEGNEATITCTLEGISYQDLNKIQYYNFTDALFVARDKENEGDSGLGDIVLTGESWNEALKALENAANDLPSQSVPVIFHLEKTSLGWKIESIEGLFE